MPSIFFKQGFLKNRHLKRGEKKVLNKFSTHNNILFLA
jgi:hypothetical protein